MWKLPKLFPRAAGKATNDGLARDATRFVSPQKSLPLKTCRELEIN